MMARRQRDCCFYDSVINLEHEKTLVAVLKETRQRAVATPRIIRSCCALLSGKCGGDLHLANLGQKDVVTGRLASDLRDPFASDFLSVALDQRARIQEVISHPVGPRCCSRMSLNEGPSVVDIAARTSSSGTAGMIISRRAALMCTSSPAASRISAADLGSPSSSRTDASSISWDSFSTGFP